MREERKSIVSVLTLVCALTALLLSVLGIAAVPEDQSHLIDDLRAENTKLQTRVDALENQLDQLITAVNLKSWILDVNPWADNAGADVVFNAVPSSYQDNFEVALVVMLNGQQVRREDCRWDGSVYTATASLDAADGYSYYCLISTPAGDQTLVLTGPDSMEAGVPVYLESSLSAYCNLVVENWKQNRSKDLTLTSAYAQVQLPRISADGAVEINTCEVVLRLNGDESVRIPIKLDVSEVEGSFELTITDLEIPMPKLQDSDMMELLLEVSLSDGRSLSAYGITWYKEKGKLVAAVG